MLLSNSADKKLSGHQFRIGAIGRALCAITFAMLVAGCDSEPESGPDFPGQPETPKASVGYGGMPAYALSDPFFPGADDPDTEIDPTAHTELFAGSGTCGTCHNDMEDDEGNEVSFEKDWQSSTMANSARDPYWRAKAAATLKNHPDLASKVDDTCTRCHAPMANEAAKKAGNEYKFISDGFKSTDQYYDHAMDGVSCTLCHQIEDTGILGTEEGSSGNFSIASFTEAEKQNRPAYGPVTNPEGTYMTTNADYTPLYGAHMSESAVCATCHDLKTPKLDEEGAIIPGTIKDYFQEQQTFSEWENSDYRNGGTLAASCQDCHMPEVKTTTPLASAGTNTRRQNVSRHTFLGANTVMLDMFENFKTELGIEAEGFPEAIERNREFLKTAASLEITGIRNDGDDVVTSLKLTNHTGHKLPSGYPSRRVFVHFIVTDLTGAVVFESGKINPDGSIDGVDGDRNYNLFEPHYNTIKTENEVQVYEAIMANANDKVTHSLVEGVRYYKDNRLSPKGFDKALVDNDIAVIGNAANDNNFNAGLDFFEYRLSLPEGSYHMLAVLRYQPLAFGHLEYLFKDTDIAEVDQFKTIYDATTADKSEVISSDFEFHTR